MPSLRQKPWNSLIFLVNYLKVTQSPSKGFSFTRRKNAMYVEHRYLIRRVLSQQEPIFEEPMNSFSIVARRLMVFVLN